MLKKIVQRGERGKMGGGERGGKWEEGRERGKMGGGEREGENGRRERMLRGRGDEG